MILYSEINIDCNEKNAVHSNILRLSLENGNLTIGENVRCYLRKYSITH